MNCYRDDVLTEEALLILLLKRALKKRQKVKSFDVKSEKTVSFAGGVPVLKKTATVADLPPLSPRKSPEVSGMVAPLSSLSMKTSPTLKKSPTSRTVSPLPPLTPRKSPTLTSSLPPLTPRKSPLPPLTPRKSPLPPLTPRKSPVSALDISDYKLSPLPKNTEATLPELSKSPLPELSKSPLPVKKKLPPLSKLTAL